MSVVKTGENLKELKEHNIAYIFGVVQLLLPFGRVAAI